MISRVDRFARILAMIGIAAALVGAAAAANQGGREVLADWNDNQTLDRSWSCEFLLDGLAWLPADRRPEDLPMRDDIERQLRVQCADWKGATKVESTSGARPTQFSSAGRAVFESDTMRSATPAEFNPAYNDTGTEYPVPWEIVIAGIVSGGLVVLIGASAARHWRMRY